MGTDALLMKALLRAFLARFRFGGKRFQAIADGAKPAGRRMPKLPDAAWRAVGREVMALHEAYTGGGDFGHGRNPLHRHQAGYQFYYLPRNVFRVRHVLRGLPWREDGAVSQLSLATGSAPDGSRTLRILDLGCGTGAFSLALLIEVAGHPASAPGALEIVMVDQGRSLLALALENIRAYAALALPGSSLHLETHSEGVEAYLASESRRGIYDVVGGGMMLNEMALLASRRAGKRAARFAAPVMRLARQGALVMFVEPGTRKGYMNLMALREQMGRMPILFPCPHDKPCPIWSPKVHRWCHATRPLPEGFAFDAELRARGGLGFAMREINLAGLAFQQSAAGRLLHPFHKPRGARIVSGRLPGRGGKRERQGREGGAADAFAESVVLQCGEKGTLQEIASAQLGEYPRGLWLAHGARRARRR